MNLTLNTVKIVDIGICLADHWLLLLLLFIKRNMMYLSRVNLIELQASIIAEQQSNELFIVSQPSTHSLCGALTNFTSWRRDAFAITSRNAIGFYYIQSCSLAMPLQCQKTLRLITTGLQSRSTFYGMASSHRVLIRLKRITNLGYLCAKISEMNQCLL